ncbi:hypothetical protein ACE5IS_17640 [Leptospira wolffii]|uniref:Lipoprotein n=1 Tax=Leptospira wolffii TaxID=409998 RepID=A0ABV5BRY0_9LEPT
MAGSDPRSSDPGADAQGREIMKYYKVIIYSVFLFCFAACPKPQSEKDGETNLLINLIVMYNDGMFNPKEYFCRSVNAGIPNNQEVFVNSGQGVKKVPGANGTNLELKILDSSGCKIRFELYYCDWFDNAIYLLSPPPNPGTCETSSFGYLEGPSGNQIICSINRSDYFKYAIYSYSVDATGKVPTTCDYSIKVTDF